MGWTFTHRDKGMSQKEFFMGEFGGETTTVLDAASGSFDRHNVYVAVKLRDSKVIGVACLTRWVPRDYYNFGYKDMSEDMGPVISDCPERILKLLSPVEELFTNEGSRDCASRWRERCWENIKSRKNRIKLSVGKKVRIIRDLPLTYETMPAGTILTVLDARRRIFSMMGIIGTLSCDRRPSLIWRK
jgi:hypothetical protein